MKKILLISMLLFASSTAIQSQDADGLKRFEIGFQFALLERKDANTVIETLRNNGFTGAKPKIISEAGLGGRFTFNLTKNIALEAEVNGFPQDKRSDSIIGVPLDVNEPGGRKLQGLFGPKIGIRREKFGAFGKLRPGFFGMDRYEVVNHVGPPDNFSILSEIRRGVYFFNLDVGGVLEYYPTKRTIIRVDVGDTIIRYDAKEPKNLNPSFTRHNLQINAGFGFRF